MSRVISMLPTAVAVHESAPWPPDEGAAFLARTQRYRTAIINTLGSTTGGGRGAAAWAQDKAEAAAEIARLGEKPKRVRRSGAKMAASDA